MCKWSVKERKKSRENILVICRKLRTSTDPQEDRVKVKVRPAQPDMPGGTLAHTPFAFCVGSKASSGHFAVSAYRLPTWRIWVVKVVCLLITKIFIMNKCMSASLCCIPGSYTLSYSPYGQIMFSTSARQQRSDITHQTGQLLLELLVLALPVTDLALCFANLGLLLCKLTSQISDDLLR